MTEEKKDSKSKVIIIILIVIIVLLLAGGALVTVLLLQKGSDGKPTENVQSFSLPPSTTSEKTGGTPVIDYDDSAVALDADDLARQYIELQDKMNEGNVSLEFQNVAFSENGTDFTCYLANSASNTEDMYFNIYKDGTFTEQIYLSGLLPPGKVIESFHSEIKFDTGKYEVVCLFTTVADDHNTITSQTPVVITLEVG